MIRLICACMISFWILGCSSTTTSKIEKDEDSKLMAVHNINTWNEWKDDRLEDLLAPKGWFSLIGLHWLSEGENTIGSSSNSKIKLDNRFPEDMGSFQVHNDTIYYACNADVEIEVNGSPFTSVKINNVNEGTQEFNYGSLFWYVIKRNGKYGIRIKDSSIPSRIRISAIPYFEYNSDLLVRAQVISTKATDSVKIVNVLGMETKYHVAGQLKFKYNNKSYKLNALGSENSDYFIIISDETSGESTYGGGRYLYVPRNNIGGNEVIIDFNKAINPPCVFTNYATCPLPPKSNHLNFKVNAGEKKWNH